MMELGYSWVSGWQLGEVEATNLIKFPEESSEMFGLCVCLENYNKAFSIDKFLEQCFKIPFYVLGVVLRISSKGLLC